MEFVLVAILSGVIGAIGVVIYNRLFSATGTLRIDDTDVDKDVFSIEVDNLNDLFYKKYLKLTIVKNDAQK